MKKIIINNSEELEAEKIIKAKDSIIGYIEGKEVFSFKGIKDFSLFKLKDNAEYDTEENLIDQFILDSINMQMQIDALIQASLGGN